MYCGHDIFLGFVKKKFQTNWTFRKKNKKTCGLEKKIFSLNVPKIYLQGGQSVYFGHPGNS